MLFSSLVFLWLFLPLVLILYRLLPPPCKNALLLAASLLFYAWGEPKYILLMLGSITLNYLGGLLLARLRGRAKTAALVLVVAANLALLGYYKYYSFAGDTLAALLHRQVLPVREIALPLGISFYTFQAMSYIIDLYRGSIRLQKNWFLLALYISFFPQLVAGPIVRYSEVEAQLRSRTADLTGFCYGIKRFLYGLSKKVILSNCFAARADEVFGLSPELVSTPLHSDRDQAHPPRFRHHVCHLRAVHQRADRRHPRRQHRGLPHEVPRVDHGLGLNLAAARCRAENRGYAHCA